MSPEQRREAIRKLVDAAPEFTPQQRVRLGALLRPRTHRRTSH